MMGAFSSKLHILSLSIYIYILYVIRKKEDRLLPRRLSCEVKYLISFRNSKYYIEIKQFKIDTRSYLLFLTYLSIISLHQECRLD